MKERKKFFDNNRLNKGHKKLPNPVQSDANVVRKKYQHILPPIEMLEHYEELNPGTIDKLLDMAQKEQNHRHSIDLITIEKYNKATKLGRMFSLVFVALISIASLMLVAAGSMFVAAIFAFSAFACITIVSYFYSKNSPAQGADNSNSSRSRGYRGNRNNKKYRA
ncbi:MAG: DUF2335 domain-containing protein [Rickettsiaceae bacterium]|nr:DUF2335 domain-containing protein [Rickettsiaceae bacterium]